jgi:C4-dicarboxylate-specific signal transduction histidine kinase
MTFRGHLRREITERTAVDVTERRQADEERERLRQAQADLAHVSRVTMMGALTASLAHEMNQPIAAAVTDAKTCLRWLQRERPNVEEACEAASRVVRDATRAADIIGRMRLLFTKGTREPERVDCNEVVREMIVLLRGEINRHAISVHADLAADLPPVLGDRVQVQQVMMNLIMNSIEAMKDADGMRELFVRSRTTADRLTISISDTGVGLPADHRDRIFDAFFTTKADGTGMGLAISRSIVESLGGRLWADDGAVDGASFHLTLPAASPR